PEHRVLPGPLLSVGKVCFHVEQPFDCRMGFPLLVAERFPLGDETEVSPGDRIHGLGPAAADHRNLAELVNSERIRSSGRPPWVGADPRRRQADRQPGRDLAHHRDTSFWIKPNRWSRNCPSMPNATIMQAT